MTAELSPAKRIARYQEKLWIAPLVGVILAFTFAGATLLIDDAFDLRTSPLPVFVGEGDTARSLLSAIAGAVATLLALVFTIIAVIIQVATGQYSPRLLPTLTRDRPTHFTIGIFVTTFTYALVVLLSLRIASDDDTVAGLSVTLAFVLAVISLVTFAIYSHHIVHSVRISSIVQRIGAQTRQAIDALYPEPLGARGQARERPRPPAEEPDLIIPASEPGVLVRWDGDALCETAAEYNNRIRLVPKPGEFVPAGAPLIEVYGAAPSSQQQLHDMVTLAPEPSLERDVSFGLRQLSDVAIRAMSAGIDDPATAVQAVDQIHDLLRRLVTRDLDHGSQVDGRVFATPITWQDILSVGVEEVRLSATGSRQVAARIRGMLTDLISVAPETRRASLERELELLAERDGASG